MTTSIFRFAHILSLRLFFVLSIDPRFRSTNIYFIDQLFYLLGSNKTSSTTAVLCFITAVVKAFMDRINNIHKLAETPFIRIFSTGCPKGIGKPKDLINGCEKLKILWATRSLG